MMEGKVTDRCPYFGIPPKEPSTITLDHVILYVPYAYIKSPPEWLTKHFTITPGGVHSNGKTANSLIILKSGAYIELLAFVDDRPDHWYKHRWGKKKFGWCDWALTYQDQRDLDDVLARMKPAKGPNFDAVRMSGPLPDNPYKYEQPVKGGRTKPNGTKIEWETIFPEKRVEPGAMPFWCRDITPRELRVPMDEVATSHPCKATGIKSIEKMLYWHSSGEINDAFDKILKDTNGELKQPFSGRTVSLSMDGGDNDEDEESVWGEGQAQITSVILYAEEGAPYLRIGLDENIFSIEGDDEDKGGREFSFSVDPIMPSCPNASAHRDRFEEPFLEMPLDDRKRKHSLDLSEIQDNKSIRQE